MDFRNRVALVTGGGTGIGRAVSLKLAEAGCKIALHYNRSSSEAAETLDTLKSMGADAIPVQADVRNDHEVRRMVQSAADYFGAIHHLVNNASTTRQIVMTDLEAATDEVWDELLDVNLKGMFYCARAVAPVMSQLQGCSIVNMGSVAGITGVGSSLPYAVSKAAVHGLTKSLAHALAPGIRVNAVAPGAVATRWWKGEEEKMLRLSGHLPLQRISTPEDIAELVCAILGQASLTGQIISPNNGMVI